MLAGEDVLPWLFNIAVAYGHGFYRTTMSWEIKLLPKQHLAPTSGWLIAINECV